MGQHFSSFKHMDVNEIQNRVCHFSKIILTLFRIFTHFTSCIFLFGGFHPIAKISQSYGDVTIAGEGLQILHSALMAIEQ